MLNECPPPPLWTTSRLAGDTASPLLMFLSPGRSSTSSRLWACSVHLHSSSFKTSTLVGTVIIKKSTNSKCWRGCGGKETLLHCWWECKLAQPLWETVWRFLQKPKIEPPYDPDTSGYLSEKYKNSSSKRHAPQCS